MPCGHPRDEDAQRRQRRAQRDAPANVSGFVKDTSSSATTGAPRDACRWSRETWAADSAAASIEKPAACTSVATVRARLVRRLSMTRTDTDNAARTRTWRASGDAGGLSSIARPEGRRTATSGHSRHDRGGAEARGALPVYGQRNPRSTRPPHCHQHHGSLVVFRPHTDDLREKQRDGCNEQQMDRASSGPRATHADDPCSNARHYNPERRSSSRSARPLRHPWSNPPLQARPEPASRPSLLRPIFSRIQPLEANPHHGVRVP